MADQKITELPIKGVSGINLADYLLGIDAAEGYQMLISDLAKKIIEQYAGSTLAGTAQPIKDALDTVAENAYGNIATIESGTTASKAYAVGDRMVLDGLLYKVTSAITQGGTITIGSNVILDALADDVAAVEGKIGNTSISGIGNGTITGALSTLNGNFKPTTLYRPLSADQKSNWSYSVPHTGTLYLYFTGTVRTYCPIFWNSSIIGSVSMPSSSVPLIQTVTINVKKGDTIVVNALNNDCYLSGTGTCLIASKVD